MKKLLYVVFTLFLLTFCRNVQAQLYQINFEDKAKNASLIAEGKVIAQKCFWNETHNMIFYFKHYRSV